MDPGRSASGRSFGLTKPLQAVVDRAPSLREDSSSGKTTKIICRIISRNFKNVCIVLKSKKLLVCLPVHPQHLSCNKEMLGLDRWSHPTRNFEGEKKKTQNPHFFEYKTGVQEKLQPQKKSSMERLTTAKRVILKAKDPQVQNDPSVSSNPRLWFSQPGLLWQGWRREAAGLEQVRSLVGQSDGHGTCTRPPPKLTSLADITKPNEIAISFKTTLSSSKLNLRKGKAGV